MRTNDAGAEDRRPTSWSSHLYRSRRRGWLPGRLWRRGQAVCGLRIHIFCGQHRRLGSVGPSGIGREAIGWTHEQSVVRGRHGWSDCVGMEGDRRVAVEAEEHTEREESKATLDFTVLARAAVLSRKTQGRRPTDELSRGPAL